MGRIAVLAEGWPLLIFLGLGVFMALAATALLGWRKRRRGEEALDGLSEVEEGDGEESRPTEHGDIGSVLRGYVVPQRAEHPDWDRMDGAVGVPGRPLVIFERDMTRYAINGETRFEPLLAALDWMEAHPGEDPLEIPAGGKIGLLRLRSDIWPAARDVRIETI